MIAWALLAFPAHSQSVASANGAVLRGLDKVTGISTDIDISRGESKTFGRLTVSLDDCRYPSENPSANAYAHLTIVDQTQNAPVFNGWMIAASPALSALDHARYDVWVLRCSNT